MCRHAGERQITLADLATQSSGLPRLPTNMPVANPANPYADYTAGLLYQFLDGYQLTRDPGQAYEYSNLGVGLLGYALARAGHGSYESLLRTRILTPLGMGATGITLTEDMRSRLAPGHDAAGQAVPNWDLSVLAGAGGLRSNVNDLLTFLAANLDTRRGPLARACALARHTREVPGQSGRLGGPGDGTSSRPAVIP